MRTKSPIPRLLINNNETIAGSWLRGNKALTGDVHLTAMPVDAITKLSPPGGRFSPFLTLTDWQHLMPSQS